MELQKSRRNRGAAAALIAILSIYAATAEATTIDIALGSAPNITSHIATSIAALNGLHLRGQTLSLDFTFTNGEFLRLFSITNTSFNGLLTLQTNHSGVVGFLSGTGYLFDQHGNPLQQPEELGRASGNDGSLFAGLNPLLGGDLERPLDFFGIHFDLTLPVNRSVKIRSGKFTLSSDTSGPFGVGPGLPPDIVPDVGSTVLFLTIALAGLIPLRACVRAAA
jgi:hypothetical protein